MIGYSAAGPDARAPISKSAPWLAQRDDLEIGASVGGKQQQLRLELLLFAIVLAIVNAPTPGGAWRGQFTFIPAAVAHGEWWRVITHPFAHVSWYHLLLDGTAFFMLYAELRDWSSRQRLAAVGACALGSLLAALTSPIIATQGFGGLSGVAHGLMAISALEMIRRGGSWEHRAGCCAFLMVTGKAAYEAATGQVALSFLHFGMMGTPVAVCHAGGVIGGLVCHFCVLRRNGAMASVTAETRFL